MQFQKQIKNRKSNRLKEYDYSQERWYFVAICTKDRECFLGDVLNGKSHLSAVGQTAERCWREIPAHFPNAILDEFIIMPNHIHGIIGIINDNNVRNKNFCSLQWQTKWARSLSSIIRGFKIGVTKWCRENHNDPCREQKFLFPTWQKSYFDHIIRNEKSLWKIREYIVNNPLNWENDRNNAENLWM